MLLSYNGYPQGQKPVTIIVTKQKVYFDDFLKHEILVTNHDSITGQIQYNG